MNSSRLLILWLDGLLVTLLIRELNKKLQANYTALRKRPSRLTNRRQSSSFFFNYVIGCWKTYYNRFDQYLYVCTAKIFTSNIGQRTKRPKQNQLSTQILRNWWQQFFIRFSDIVRSFRNVLYNIHSPFLVLARIELIVALFKKKLIVSAHYLDRK